MELHARTLDLHTRHPFIIARGGHTHFRTVLVTLRDQDGLEGIGEAAATAYYGETVDTVTAVLGDYAAQLGNDPWAIAAIEERLQHTVGRNPAARAALSMALHDLLGRRVGQPLWRLWGLDPQRVPQTTFTVGLDTLDRIASKAAEAVADGYPILKVKLGGEDDAGVLAAIRSAHAGEIRVDANAAWSAATAIRILPMLAEFGVTLLEQPVPADDIEGLRRVRQAASIPVMADESCVTSADIPRLVGVVDGINIKLAKCGSLREAHRMIAIARAHHLQVMLGCMIESSVGITAAAHLAPLADYLDLDGAALLADDPFIGVTIAGGAVRLPDAPGLGVRAR